MSRFTILISGCALIVAFAVNAEAQKIEISPYAGGFFPGKFAGVLEMANGGIFGIKGGVYVAGPLEAEGNLSYINNLAFDGTLTRKRGYLWDGSAAYNFHLFRLHPKFYGSFGVGALITSVSADSVEFWGSSIPTKDSFLSLSYGGGMKSLRQWGPLGYRVDARLRTLPDYYGFRVTWPEVTAGVTLSWGGGQ
jgi:hypothetical protein